tara:strand:+ start:44 stop:706 length:663 start_codon:yes stop_codon:yes gene_type:complete
MFSKIVYDGFFHSFTSVLTYKKENNIIIDPMSCMVKLALLGFYPKGTKISIYNNQLLFNEPSILQGTLRYYYGYGREDLHNLYNPIQKCIDWYWTQHDKNILLLFSLAVAGLENLINTYSVNCTIKHTLNYYINLIKNREKSKKISEESQTENKIHAFLKDLWSQREINVIIDILRELEEKKSVSNYEKEGLYLLKSINIITTNKEEKLNTFMMEHVSIL